MSKEDNQRAAVSIVQGLQRIGHPIWKKCGWVDEASGRVRARAYKATPGKGRSFHLFAFFEQVNGAQDLALCGWALHRKGEVLAVYGQPSPGRRWKAHIPRAEDLRRLWLKVDQELFGDLEMEAREQRRREEEQRRREEEQRRRAEERQRAEEQEKLRRQGMRKRDSLEKERAREAHAWRQTGRFKRRQEASRKRQAESERKEEEELGAALQDALDSLELNERGDDEGESGAPRSSQRQRRKPRLLPLQVLVEDVGIDLRRRW